MRARVLSQSKRSKWIMYSTVALVFPNLVAFTIASYYLGGDALNGYVTAGHYFLCAHGSCTEVGESIWKYSYWHALTALYGIMLVFVEAAIFANTGDIVFDFDKRA
jgi:hypothetical protein